MQNLNLTIFGPLEDKCNSNCSDFICNFTETPVSAPRITLYDIAGLGVAYPLAFTLANILKTFSISGINLLTQTCLPTEILCHHMPLPTQQSAEDDSPEGPRMCRDDNIGNPEPQSEEPQLTIRSPEEIWPYTKKGKSTFLTDKPVETIAAGISKRKSRKEMVNNMEED
ncbi:hypothetical protein PR048_011158 [Dryococelus australis]|uniref:Uncharacterized protein n=1 Tax=Dryococelus australis TaxID=614101 RepID=A0ABQ9HL40_9NEOP|nr:hypothetical protein PR048_011158 [Dryococelus australis]